MSRPGDMHQADEPAAQPPRWDGIIGAGVWVILAVVAAVMVRSS
jgi:hypothetical protein